MDLFTVDAFTDQPFSGNPAAVCVLRDALEPATMQSIAMEMNLSETAFVSVRTTEEGEGASETLGSAFVFDLRWFTPTCEVPLCGHATLATAAVLFNVYDNRNTELRFHTTSGVLQAVRSKNIINLDLPLAPCAAQDSSELAELVRAAVGNLQLADCQFASSVGKLLLRLKDCISRQQLEALSPSSQTLLAAHSGKVKGIIVTVKGSEGYDFFSRYFAPWVGIPEDPVTGSAHAVLAGYWSEQLGKRDMRARQCSPRGGDVMVRMEEDGRVTVGGPAFIVSRGRLCI